MSQIEWRKAEKEGFRRDSIGGRTARVATVMGARVVTTAIGAWMGATAIGTWTGAAAMGALVSLFSLEPREPRDNLEKMKKWAEWKSDSTAHPSESPFTQIE